MIYPPYSVQALRWEQLSSLSSQADTKTSDLSPSLREAQEKLRRALYEQAWLLEDNQHLEVPPTHLDDYQGHIFSMGDFLRRADDARVLDVQQCAVDETGARRLLTPEQLQCLKQTGELKVPSELFENQYHTWKVAPGFYSGRQSVSRSFGEGFGGAVDHYIVYTSDAIVKNDENTCHPTLQKAFVNGFVRAGRKLKEAIGQLFVGRLQHRTYSDGFIDEVLGDAEQSYIYYHLREHDTRCLFGVSFGETLAKSWEILGKEDADFVEKYRFRTTVQEDQEEEARARLDEVRESFEANMEIKHRSQLNVDESTASKAPQAALKDFMRANKEWQDRKKDAWLDHLKNLADDELQALGRLEAERLLALQIEENVEREDREQVEKEIQTYEAALKEKHPFLSLSKAWRKRKIDSKRLKIEAALQSTWLERIAQRLEDEGLGVQSASRKLTADFRKELRQPLAQKLRDKKSAFPPATFNVLQLNPNNWTFHGGGAINRYKTIEVDMGKRSWRLRYLWMMTVTLTKAMVGGSFHF